MKFSTAIAFGLGLIAAAAVLVIGARADTTYACGDGSTMTYVDATRAMIIRRDGKPDIALPYAGALSRFATWSAGGMEAVGERNPPFAEYWQPAVGPAEIIYDLGDGERRCVEKQ